LEHDPNKRPSGTTEMHMRLVLSIVSSNLLTLFFYGIWTVVADELLASDLLPRKIELEQRYLAEALEILTSSQVCVNSFM
jgi:hypothetical protein